MPVAHPLKRCLVTGASGFVGKELCEQLQRNGIFVRALLRHNQSGPWSETVPCDLTSFEQSSKKIFSDIDTIFYLASISHNSASPEEYDFFNVKLCLRFAESAIQHGVKNFIYVSSTKAMAEPHKKIVDEKFLDWPEDHYGISKRKAEEGLLALTGFDHLVIIRPCLIYGKGVKGNILSMLKLIEKGIFPPLPETGANRSMVSVRDVASALILSATTSTANRNIYLITDGIDYSVKEIENAMRHALHKKARSWYIPEKLLIALASIGDLLKKVLGRFPFNSGVLHKLLGAARYSSEKIQKELGWRPTENFLKVLPEIVDDFIFWKKPK